MAWICADKVPGHGELQRSPKNLLSIPSFLGQLLSRASAGRTQGALQRTAAGELGSWAKIQRPHCAEDKEVRYESRENEEILVNMHGFSMTA